ncbi:heat-inducible transcription repressor [Actinobaculum suis]|uniref:Heat-inducible transcription repressor HrcA n=1 Tax=Actinobaculum suis TaxID=1657 RepID=A0A1B9BBF9_9ACTO|nr:heat-inducible transcriptional repressor HrcA [Actinobaculum suis]OCA93819.1 heat-inducible transcriptional repressor HrcA [Actinobaculum suis]OCA94112.1 heat-inducible transcriptional repressor HrcA [Actinobaculum suis]VDG76382.1 heat-inducible transcription repressor [Actinobaculum suis]
MATAERRERVLEAIIRDYVTTSEPVGSKRLVERYRLGVSPATVRNDMAVLEEQGLIAQPHTSAGRIPTDAGYRHFVDSIDRLRPLSAGERRAIEKLLEGAVDLDDVLSRAARLLSQITQQVAVVQYPSLERVTLRHLELIPTGETLAVLVLITSAGRVEQRVLRLRRPVGEETVETLSRELNAAAVGNQLAEAAQKIRQEATQLPAPQSTIATIVAEVIDVAASAETEDRLALAGTANLSRHAVDFTRTIAPVLDALEEQVILLKLLADMDTGIAVSIGAENEHEDLAETSVVASTYDVRGDAVARLGVIGPTRMDYPGNMVAVRAVAKYLSRILSEQ